MEVSFNTSGQSPKNRKKPGDLPPWKPPMLPDPPRRVPLMIQLRMMFGGYLTQFGWGIFGFGMIFFWGFVVNIDYASLYRYHGKLETVQASVTTTERTSFSEGGSKTRSGTPIYKNRFTFTPRGGKKFECVSYSLGEQVSAGETVDAEYPEDEPQYARIVGMRTKPMPIFIIFVAIFPLAGLVMLGCGLSAGVNACRLLTSGKIAGGVLTSKVPTNTRINNQRVYKLTFSFRADDGKDYNAVAQNHVLDKLEDDDYEPLLYDPNDPSKSVLLGNVPGAVFVDDLGEIRVENPARNLSCLILPMLVCAGNFMWIWSQYLEQ